MTKHQPSLGTGKRLFPNERATQMQKAEETFLQEHSGLGPRALYQISEAFSHAKPAKPQKKAQAPNQIVVFGRTLTSR